MHLRMLRESYHNEVTNIVIGGSIAISKFRQLMNRFLCCFQDAVLRNRLGVSNDDVELCELAFFIDSTLVATINLSRVF